MGGRHSVLPGGDSEHLDPRNIRVDLGPLQEIFITPNYHRVHHGARGLSNKNLGFILTIWDRMFGTYVSPQSVGKGFALGFIPARKRLLRMIVGL